MRLLAFAVSFLIAFLLFSVQPMATKLVLPTLGGTPAVWNTAMFTFQFLLLLGYLYAHLLSHHMKLRWQLPAHALVVAAACQFLPMMVQLPEGEAVLTHPIAHLVTAFVTGLGLPFLCLAATAPLLQAWVSRSQHPLSRTPYVLYSASNFGSFAGLIGYVLLIEPQLDLAEQRMGWSALFISGMLLLLLTGKALRFGAVAQEPAATYAPGWREKAVWIWLAFLPSSLSLGVTTHIATDVASIPLLWVLPLSLYLLSYVDAFRSRPICVALCQRLAPLLGLVAVVCYGVSGLGITSLFILELLVFAMLALAIHGWLAKRQPPHAYLTQFYICLAVGGMLGGACNGLLAPLLLRDALEYPIMLLLASVTAFLFLRRTENPLAPLQDQLRVILGVGVTMAVCTLLSYAVQLLLDGTLSRHTLDSRVLMYAASMAGFMTLVRYRRFDAGFYSCAMVLLAMVVALSNGLVGYATLYKDRNFFGVSRVYENRATQMRYLIHDTTMHGMQSLDPAMAHRPASYYWPVKAVLAHLHAGRKYPAAAVGLGVGTVACVMQPKQPLDFFEINPMDITLAEDTHYFSYLKDCPAASRVQLGDGRILLSQQPDGRYGVIVLDAFSSDAIPAHLLTREALAMYLAKLAPQGLLLIHTTNRHIDLWPLLAAQASALGAVAYGQFFEAPPEQSLQSSSYWVMVAPAQANAAPVLAGMQGWQKLVDEGDRPWTDQYVNLLPYFKVLR